MAETKMSTGKKVFYIFLAIFVIVVIVVILVLIGLGIWGIIYLVQHDNSNSIPNTAAATSNGALPDGSNSISTFTGNYVGTSLSSLPTNGVGCNTLFNKDYVGYKLNNQSNYTQNVYLYGSYQGNTICSNSGSLYLVSILAPGTSLWWKDNKATYGNTTTVKTFYYNTLVGITSTNSVEYYAIGNSSNMINPIENDKQYLNINFLSNGTINFSVVNN